MGNFFNCVRGVVVGSFFICVRGLVVGSFFNCVRGVVVGTGRFFNCVDFFFRYRKRVVVNFLSYDCLFSNLSVGKDTLPHHPVLEDWEEHIILRVGGGILQHPEGRRGHIAASSVWGRTHRSILEQ